MTSNTPSMNTQPYLRRSFMVRAAALIGLICAFVAATVIVSQVHAHGNATGIVKERMDLMKGMGDRTKALGAMIKGKTNFDPATVREAAIFIGEASTRFVTLFPAGSDQKPTEALPTVWTEWPRFEAIAKELSAAAAKLEATTDSADAEAIRRPFADVAKLCMACHKQFRE